jgi:broad specificity phosphatase PhoE
MANIYVFRSGKVKHFSDKNIFCGWLNFPLDKNGLIDAKIIAKKLKNEKIDFAFCSDQLRSKQALIQVLKFHKSTKIIVDHRIRERHYGIFTGHEKEIFKEFFSKKFDEIHRGQKALIPKGENFSDLEKRVYPFITDLLFFLKDNPNSNILICAHTNSMRLIQAYFENIDEDDISKIENSSINYKKYVLNFCK